MGVWIARSPRPDYQRDSAAETLRRLLTGWGLDRENAGTARWNPFGAWIQPGSRVTLKPNWVLHANQSGEGLDCLVTHASVIAAVLEYVAAARPAQVTIGDAPVQGCDFAALRRLCGLDEILERYSHRGFDVSVADFRRTILREKFVQRDQQVRGLEQYVLFDLGAESLLAPLDADAQQFRVTMYDPEALRRTHAPGVHQYLVAREVIDTDTVINLPKLKAHKKACITGALKNVIGINGNKEYLPHHRKGGAGSGGDCYAGGSAWKRAAEELLDTANRREPGHVQRLLYGASERLAGLAGDHNLEGSWYGNDTIWRTSLDLQRILAYGGADGRMHAARQRNVVHITDAIIGGEGEGPLAPLPVPSGFLSGSESAPAAEWVHALLMGFDPEKVPLVREAFGGFAYPLARGGPQDIRVWIDGEETPCGGIEPFGGRAFRPPAGWAGHCERALAANNR